MGFLGGSVVKDPPAKEKMRASSLGWEFPLEKEMATRSSILAWEVPWIEEPGRLASVGLQSQTWLSDWAWAHSEDTYGISRVMCVMKEAWEKSRVLFGSEANYIFLNHYHLVTQVRDLTVILEFWPLKLIKLYLFCILYLFPFLHPCDYCSWSPHHFSPDVLYHTLLPVLLFKSIFHLVSRGWSKTDHFMPCINFLIKGLPWWLKW